MSEIQNIRQLKLSKDVAPLAHPDSDTDSGLDFEGDSPQEQPQFYGVKSILQCRQTHRGDYEWKIEWEEGSTSWEPLANLEQKRFKTMPHFLCMVATHLRSSPTM